MTQYLVAQGTFDDHPLSLVDVGASGCIEQHWQVFGGVLRAWGFDPLVSEVSRLNSRTPGTNISYHALRITGPLKTNDDSRFTSDKVTLRDNQPFTRTSAVRAISLLNMNYAQQYFDPSGSGVITDESTTLDEFFGGTPNAAIDFIKIDTDGGDFDVLRGAERLIAEAPTLGIFIEIQFHGPVNNHANLFCNIDGFLRARGLSLFDIEVYRYSRATLPKAFAANIPAQTVEGQVLWGDALYLRDFGDRDYERMWGITLPAVKMLKLAAIHEIFGLEDCAAEILCKYRSDLDRLVDVTHCLNLLTPEFVGKKLTFDEYVKAFDNNPRRWFHEARAQYPQTTPHEVFCESSPGSKIPAQQDQEIVRLRQQLEGWQQYWRSLEKTAGWRLLSAWRHARDRLAPERTVRRRCYDFVMQPLRGRGTTSSHS
jgi:hypothetical protein